MIQHATSECFSDTSNGINVHTKRVILEVYDELAEAIAVGRPYHTRLDPRRAPVLLERIDIAAGRAYHTRLDPPPADPRVAHPPRTSTKPTETLASVDGE